MPEVRRRKLEGAVWVPLRSATEAQEGGRYGDLGHLAEFYGVGTLAVAVQDRAKAEKLGWREVGLLHDHTGGLENGKYVPSDVRPSDYDGFEGLYLVLDQRGNREELPEWHLHQDLVITLRLKREGDVWVALDEGYIEVAKLERNDRGSPRLLSVRASHLKDYLCARGMALYVTSYRQRREIVADASHIKWPANPHEELTSTDRWEGRVSEIHEGGMPYGEKVAVFHSTRTDVDPEVDVPTIGLPDEANVESSSWTKEFSGRKLFVVEGQLWRREWVEPAASSPIVRRDKMPATVFFITDAAGKQETRDTLAEGGRWLWFRPEVVMALADRRGGSLGWYTRDTGAVACSPEWSPVHFGINSRGLVNVYAKDVALLPDWQQRIWAGHNVAPDAGVSEELLASQARARPARTQAPEPFLEKGLELVGKVLQEKVGVAALRFHGDIPGLLRRAHRFRATDQAGLLSLAKDLARVTADSFDAAAIQKRVAPPRGEKWGSLKSLEKLLATEVGAERASTVMRPLFGIYELRLADAHLPAGELDESLDKVGVDKAAPYVVQGYQLLRACVGTVYAIIEIVKGWKDAT